VIGQCSGEEDKEWQLLRERRRGEKEKWREEKERVSSHATSHIPFRGNGTIEFRRSVAASSAPFKKARGIFSRENRLDRRVLTVFDPSNKTSKDEKRHLEAADAAHL